MWYLQETMSYQSLVPYRSAANLALWNEETACRNMKQIYIIQNKTRVSSDYSISEASQKLDIASFVSNAIQRLHVLVQFFTNFSNTCGSCFLASCLGLIVVASITSLWGPNLWHDLQLRVENTHITYVTQSGLYRCSLGDPVVFANGITLQAVWSCSLCWSKNHCFVNNNLYLLPHCIPQSSF